MTAPGSDHLIGGIHAVRAVLEQGRAVSTVWIAADAANTRIAELITTADRNGVPVQKTSRATLDDWLVGITHQGCAAAVAPIDPLSEKTLAERVASIERPLVLALDQVQDPHNLGACLRSAAAAGATAVIAPRKRAASVNATVRKVAAGAAEVVPFVPVTNLARALARLQSAGLWVVGLDGAAPHTIHDIDMADPVVIVAGGEAGGLRARTASACDWLAAIPMAGAVESLNVSVATGIALFEAVRQRRD